MIDSVMTGDANRRLRVTECADLRERNTFGVAATAPLLVEISDASLLSDALSPAIAGADALVLGGGSNMLFAADPQQSIVALQARGTGVLHDEGDTVLVRAEAGVPWHAFVLWTLDHALCGLENLALIPGTVGAAPIQNIGAYGAEVGEHVHAVEAFHRASGQLRRLDREHCRFAYRDSVFKQQADAWIVTAVQFALSRTAAPRLDYAGIGDELHAMGVATPGARDVAEAVIRIRRRKLPDPDLIGNAGSFFKNPIVPAALAAQLQAAHPTLPAFRAGDAALRKLSAAWLIDQCGWKGFRDGDAGVSDQHALVLVNHGSASGGQLLDLARRIADSVYTRFGVASEPEPRIIGASW